MTVIESTEMRRSQVPEWHLACLWLRSRLRLSRRTSRLAMGVLTFTLIAVAGVTMALGVFGSRLFVLPDHESLIDAFFRIVFVPVLYLFVAWFVVSLKFDGARTSEFLLLNSLPLTSGVIHRMSVVSEMNRLLWVPGGLVILLSALLSSTPLPFVIRLVAVTLASYCVLQIAAIALHLAVSLRGRGGALGYPSARSPLIQLGLVIMCAAVLIVGVIFPEKVSGGSFWAVLATLAAMGAGLFYVSRSLFGKWRSRNVVARSLGGRKRKTGTPYRVIAPLLDAVPRLGTNPFLIKNLVRSSREESVVSRSLLSLLFIVVAFLIAMNNDSMRDAATVLMWFFAVFAFFVVMKAVDRLGGGEEPPELIYSAPVTKGQLYLSVFLPVTVWLAAIALALAVLVGFAGGGVTLAAGFFIRSVLIALFFTSIAVSLGVKFYPDPKEALKHFLAWMLVTALLVVVFYKFRAIVSIAAVLLSLSMMTRARLYRA